MNLLALSASIPSPLQQILSTLQKDLASDSGQTSPTNGTNQATTAPAASPRPGGSASAQFSTDTLSALISAQEGRPSASTIASKMIGSLDANGDGSLSLDEVEKALNGGNTTSTTAQAQAFAKLDTNGDGQLNADELTAALTSMQAQSQHHGRHHHHFDLDMLANAGATTGAATTATAGATSSANAGPSVSTTA